MAWLLADIRQYLKDNDVDDGSTKAVRQYDRIANDACRAMHEAGDWSFDRKKQRLAFAAAKTAGTVSATIAGTAFTGSGTAFAAGDVDKLFRLRGEDLQYRVSAYVGAEELTCEAYRGATAASGVAYQLTQDRAALDTLFRKLSYPILGNFNVALDLADQDELLADRLMGREVSHPRKCAVEMYTVAVDGTAPAPYLWVYPAFEDAGVIDFYAFLWPLEMTAVGHGISAPAQAESVHREFCKAYLLQMQGRQQEFDNQMAHAVRAAHIALGQFRFRAHQGQKEYWTPESDGPGRVRRRRMVMAPGEGA